MKADKDSKLEPVKVLGLMPDSPAERAGIQVGDIILSADGKTITSLMEYVHAAGARFGETMKVEILRNDQPLEITIVYPPRPNQN